MVGTSDFPVGERYWIRVFNSYDVSSFTLDMKKNILLANTKPRDYYKGVHLEPENSDISWLQQLASEGYVFYAGGDNSSQREALASARNFYTSTRFTLMIPEKALVEEPHKIDMSKYITSTEVDIRHPYQYWQYIETGEIPMPLTEYQRTLEKVQWTGTADATGEEFLIQFTSLFEAKIPSSIESKIRDYLNRNGYVLDYVNWTHNDTFPVLNIKVTKTGSPIAPAIVAVLIAIVAVVLAVVSFTIIKLSDNTVEIAKEENKATVLEQIEQIRADESLTSEEKQELINGLIGLADTDGIGNGAKSELEKLTGISGTALMIGLSALLLLPAITKEIKL